MKSGLKRPLVVDVDGTLLRTDMLFESFWNALGRQPFATLLVVLLNFHHRARLKRKLAELCLIDFSLLPLNQQVVETIQRIKAEGRPIYLASGGDELLVSQLAHETKIADHYFASNGIIDMTHGNKAATLVQRFGTEGYSYIGDQMADVPVWAEADDIYVVGDSPAVHHEVSRLDKPVTYLEGSWHILDLLRAMRIYQWIKNILMFLPFFAAQRTDVYGFLQVTLGILGFSLVASSIYIFNDLIDLEADRKHPRKSKRPFASGEVPIAVGMVAAVLSGMLGLSIAVSMGRDVFAIFVLYVFTSLAYSMYLKRIRWFDVGTLASLYTLRVFAGGAAANASISLWLVGFIFPIFVSLSSVKRMTELARSSLTEKLPGRGYVRSDRRQLYWIARVAAVLSVLLFLVYTFSPTATALYQGIWELRWCAIPVSAWLYRMISTAKEGQQNYDPIIFALRDKYSLLLLGASVLGLYNAAAASFLTF